MCVCACRLPASYERTTALLSPRSRIKIQTGTSSCLETEKAWYNTGTAARLFVLSPGDDNVQPKRRGRANQEFLKWCNVISEEQQTEISPRRFVSFGWKSFVIFVHFSRSHHHDKATTLAVRSFGNLIWNTVLLLWLMFLFFLWLLCRWLTSSQDGIFLSEPRRRTMKSGPNPAGILLYVFERRPNAFVFFFIFSRANVSSAF